ncbi:membrane protein [Streptococcus varani]|uniref:Membrane protein n=1 Tax=Streptococcus varani TaxID=1608583 RepID=A0A0E4H9D2_9STRE|nr:hypothetical protein [Streptococcus varani]CQR25929.1 membrane protein [Streptococcus varani]
MARKPYYSKNKQNTGVMAIFGLIFFFFLISNLLPLLIMGGIGLGTYYLITQKSRKQKKLAHNQLLLLESNLQSSAQEMQTLGQLLDQQNYLKFEVSAKNMLQKLHSYSYVVYSIQKYIDFQDFNRISQKINSQTSAIQTELKKLRISPDSQPASSEEEIILRMAPEIIQPYRNIQNDHSQILEKIKETDNPSELEALHSISMKRFRDILDGYLKIKASPKDYYNAEERLKQAKEALLQFDLDLDETLRKLNESQLQDFEISLRMMNARQSNQKDAPNSSDIY